MAKILIGDDDTGIRAVLREAMKMFGHEVVGTFASANEAIVWLQSQAMPPCDIAILDNSFPPGNGGQVAEYLRCRFPGVKIISLSGDADPITWGDVNLAKPSRVKEIWEAITKLTA